MAPTGVFPKHLALVARMIPSWTAIHGSSPQKTKTAKLAVRSPIPGETFITVLKRNVKSARLHSGWTKDHKKPITEPAQRPLKLRRVNSPSRMSERLSILCRAIGP